MFHGTYNLLEQIQRTLYDCEGVYTMKKDFFSFFVTFKGRIDKWLDSFYPAHSQPPSPRNRIVYNLPVSVGYVLAFSSTVRLQETQGRRDQAAQSCPEMLKVWGVTSLGLHLLRALIPSQIARVLGVPQLWDAACTLRSPLHEEVTTPAFQPLNYV